MMDYHYRLACELCGFFVETAADNERDARAKALRAIDAHKRICGKEHLIYNHPNRHNVGVALAAEFVAHFESAKSDGLDDEMAFLSAFLNIAQRHRFDDAVGEIRARFSKRDIAR